MRLLDCSASAQQQCLVEQFDRVQGKAMGNRVLRLAESACRMGGELKLIDGMVAVSQRCPGAVKERSSFNDKIQNLAVH